MRNNKPEREQASACVDKSYLGDSLYGLFYTIRKKLLLACYALCIVTIGVLTIFLLGEIGVPLRFLFLTGLLMVIIGTIGGLLFSILLDLPEIGYKFDGIKNGIASKKIKTPEQFAIKVSDFICEHFRVFPLIVDYAFVQVLDLLCHFSDSSIPEKIGETKLMAIISQSQQSEDVFFVEVLRISDRDYYLYTIPIWFGEDWLGCIGIFCRHRLPKLFMSYLSSFEDECIDDQLLHILSYSVPQKLDQMIKGKLRLQEKAPGVDGTHP